ncbi:MAG: hypothetical protein QOJ59_5476 [Thermomicrobiales bacterium]|jgi:hypothetical protein|nr:hypothetical protein [Thermomicrobiales bacterium]
MSQEPEIQVDELQLFLEPIAGKVPFRSVVQSARLRLTNDVLRKMVEVALVKGRDRAPVDVELRSTRFTLEGAEVIVQVSKGRFLKTDVRAVVGLIASGVPQVRVEIKEVKALGMLPIDGFVDPVLEKALGMAAVRPGVERAPGGGRALLVRPDELLASFGVPLQFATPGEWDARTVEGELELRFRTRT